jgi:CheY-like chemotaxis protein
MSAHTASVLVVDDDYALRLSLSMVLTSVGYTVRSAVDGFSALALMRSEIPDVLISDLNMPGMGGFELLSVVHERFPSIRVIAMSGGYLGKDLPAGVIADYYHRKGCSLPALLSQVELMAVDAGLAFTPSYASHPRYVSEPITSRISNLVESAVADLICPECMRPAFHPSVETGSDIPGATCAHCAAKLS